MTEVHGSVTLKTSTSSRMSSSMVLGSLGSTMTFWTVPRSTHTEQGDIQRGVQMEVGNMEEGEALVLDGICAAEVLVRFRSRDE